MQKREKQRRLDGRRPEVPRTDLTEQENAKLIKNIDDFSRPIAGKFDKKNFVFVFLRLENVQNWKILHKVKLSHRSE